MARPKKNRVTKCDPTANYYKPRGTPLKMLEETILEKDELEALLLADYKDMSHENAAKKMKISRATFGRIVKTARYKIADSIINGKAIKIS